MRSLHHEVELGVVIGKKAVQISPQEAMEHVAGYTLALDMTARDLQDEAKSKGLPWTEAKGHDTFCPVSDFIEKNKIPDPHNIELWLKVDDQVKQKGNTKDMIFKWVAVVSRSNLILGWSSGSACSLVIRDINSHYRLPEMISYISHVMTLEPGDLILTGTPSGVGPVPAGSVITCGITGVIDMKFPVIARKSKL